MISSSHLFLGLPCLLVPGTISIRMQTKIILAMLIYSLSPNLSQISLKIALEKWVLRFWPKSKWREMKISYLAAILKIFNILSWNMVVISVYRYGVKIMKKIPVGKCFLGSMEPPLCTNGSAGYLMQLSVNSIDMNIKFTKEKLPRDKKSNLVYMFKCKGSGCTEAYVGGNQAVLLSFVILMMTKD